MLFGWCRPIRRRERARSVCNLFTDSGAINPTTSTMQGATHCTSGTACIHSACLTSNLTCPGPLHCLGICLLLCSRKLLLYSTWSSTSFVDRAREPRTEVPPFRASTARPWALRSRHPLGSFVNPHVPASGGVEDGHRRQHDRPGRRGRRGEEGRLGERGRTADGDYVSRGRPCRVVDRLWGLHILILYLWHGECVSARRARRRVAGAELTPHAPVAGGECSRVRWTRRA